MTIIRGQEEHLGLYFEGLDQDSQDVRLDNKEFSDSGVVSLRYRFYHPGKDPKGKSDFL